MILSFASLQTVGAPAGDVGLDRLVNAPVALVMPSVIALLAYLLVAWVPKASAQHLRAALWLGWVAHAMALVSDVAGWGAPGAQFGARFGFAPALSATMWLVLAVYIVEIRLLPTARLRRTVALFGAFTVALAWVFPGEVRALAASRWAPVHWALGMASYGLFGAAVLHAALLDRADRRLRLKEAAVSEPGLSVLMLERMTFRFVMAGFSALTVALVLGSVVSTTWRWDHKVVFSLMGWLVFAALLLGRHLLGWRGRQATRWLYAGAALLLLAYVGSRFVFEVLLQRSALG